MLVEVAGGIYAHSLAIVTDAAHLLSDVSGFAVSAFAAFYAAKRSHQHFSYGYHRIEVLGALASILSVWLVTGILLWEAVQRIINPEPVNGKVMFIIAIMGVVVNLLLVAILGGHSHAHGGHSHSHDHSHGEHSHGQIHSHRLFGHTTHSSRTSSTSSRSSSDNLAAIEEGGGGSGDHEKHNHSGTSSSSSSDDGHGHDHGHVHGHGSNNIHSHSPADHHHAADEAGANESSSPSGSGHGLFGHDHSHGLLGQSHNRSEHNHSHGNDHGHTHDHDNMNVRGAVIHVLGDLVQSVGVAIAGALIWYHADDPRWALADPICTFLFAALVLFTTFSILRDIADVLMERAPRGQDVGEIWKDLIKIEGVDDVHDLHVWSLTPGIPLLCAHVSKAPRADSAAVLHSVTMYCRSLGIEHTTIQIVEDVAICPCGVNSRGGTESNRSSRRSLPDVEEGAILSS